MNKTIVVFAVCIIGVLNGCISTWKLSNGTPLGKKYRYGIEIGTPQNWYKRQIRRMEFFTRHGLALEYVLINSMKWGDTLSNGYPLPPKVLLHQLPELLLGELCAGGNAYNLEIYSNAIVVIQGFPCAVARYRYTSPNSLRNKGIMYCIPFRKFLTVLYYEAEASHYYDKTVKDFMAMVNSIKIGEKEYLSLPGINIGRP